MNLKDQHNINNMNNKFISQNDISSFANQYTHASNGLDNRNQN